MPQLITLITTTLPNQEITRPKSSRRVASSPIPFVFNCTTLHWQLTLSPPSYRVLDLASKKNGQRTWVDRVSRISHAPSDPFDIRLQQPTPETCSLSRSRDRNDVFSPRA